MSNEPSYKQQIKALALDEEKFVRLTFKGQAHPAEGNPWRQVLVRPVLLKNERCWQFSYFTQKQDITKNYRQSEVAVRLDELLALPFTSISAQATDGELHVQITKKGKAILHHTQSAQANRAPDLAHDVGKKLILPSGKPDAFLQATGIMDEHGRVYPSMQAKFSQINEFLKLLEHTG